MSDEDKWRMNLICAFCGCLMEHEHQDAFNFWISRKDFSCQICCMDYQDAFDD